MDCDLSIANISGFLSFPNRSYFQKSKKQMTIYTCTNDTRQGPFTLAEIERMLADGRVNASTPAWREGLAEWLPLATILPPPPQPPAKVAPNYMGIASLAYSLFSAVVWFVLFLVAGVLQNSGRATQSSNVTIGFLVIAGMLLNLFASGVGMVSLFGRKGKTCGLTGMLLNLIFFLAIVALMAVGMYINHFLPSHV